jgi:hypothetical protein
LLAIFSNASQHDTQLVSNLRNDIAIYNNSAIDEFLWKVLKDTKIISSFQISFDWP